MIIMHFRNQWFTWTVNFLHFFFIIFVQLISNVSWEFYVFCIILVLLTNIAWILNIFWIFHFCIFLWIFVLNFVLLLIDYKDLFRSVINKPLNHYRCLFIVKYVKLVSALFNSNLHYCSIESLIFQWSDYNVSILRLPVPLHVDALR